MHIWKDSFILLIYLLDKYKKFEIQINKSSFIIKIFIRNNYIFFITIVFIHKKEENYQTGFCCRYGNCDNCKEKQTSSSLCQTEVGYCTTKNYCGTWCYTPNIKPVTDQ